MTNKKTTIYLVRHGQTEWNVDHKFQGHQDSPLTKLGVNQAQWLGESIQNEQIDVIYSSSSGRALKTAEIIKGTKNIDIIESSDMKEIHLGIWEGRSQDEVKKIYPKEFQDFWNDPEKFNIQGSETFTDVLQRAINRLNRIIDENKGMSILIVTHTIVVKLIMAYFENRPLHKIWDPPYIHPACLCKVEIELDQPQIILYGNTSHYK